ncbi:MAG: ankyrin repeat domain-containing protein [Alphaproteobacteria bacterium]
MKKTLLWTVMTVLLASSLTVSAKPIPTNTARTNTTSSKQCSYSPLQDIIRNARDIGDIAAIIQNKVDLNITPECGGTPLQLAVLRGNPQIVKALLEAGATVNADVSLAAFPIPNAPEKVPFLMFAGYYSPRQDIVRLIISAGADVFKTDSNGENILWYMEKNAVLRNTDLTDEIKNKLLFYVSPTDTASSADEERLKAKASQPMADARVPTERRKQQPLITKTADGTVGIVNEPTPVKTQVPIEAKLPDGVQIIRTGGTYQIQEIIEPDMPVVQEL